MSRRGGGTNSRERRRSADRSRQTDDPLKSELFASLGYASGHEALAGALEAAGLSNASKRRIAHAKRDAVASLLGTHFIRVCGRGDCRKAAPAAAAGREIVTAASVSFCELCLGSPARSAGLRMAAACRDAGWTRLVVVGGSPNARGEIQRSHTGAPEIRLIDGTRTRTKNEARTDLLWADHVVLWGSTQLDHKVSTLYSPAKGCTTVARRSVQALFEHIAEAARLAESPAPPRAR